MDAGFINTRGLIETLINAIVIIKLNYAKVMTKLNIKLIKQEL